MRRGVAHHSEAWRGELARLQQLIISRRYVFQATPTTEDGGEISNKVTNNVKKKEKKVL